MYSWAVAGVENWRLGVLLTGTVWRKIRYRISTAEVELTRSVGIHNCVVRPSRRGSVSSELYSRVDYREW